MAYDEKNQLPIPTSLFCVRSKSLIHDPKPFKGQEQVGYTFFLDSQSVARWYVYRPLGSSLGSRLLNHQRLLSTSKVQFNLCKYRCFCTYCNLRSWTVQVRL